MYLAVNEIATMSVKCEKQNAIVHVKMWLGLHEAFDVYFMKNDIDVD